MGFFYGRVGGRGRAGVRWWAWACWRALVGVGVLACVGGRGLITLKYTSKNG